MARTKARAKNIGHVDCPTCKRVAPIRRTTPKGHTVADGPMYVMCGNCGLLKLTTRGGNEWIRKNGKLWGVAGCPADMPAWIKDGKAYAPKELQDPDPDPKDDDEPPTVPAPAAIQQEKEPQAAPEIPPKVPEPKPAPVPQAAPVKKPLNWWDM